MEETRRPDLTWYMRCDVPFSHVFHSRDPGISIAFVQRRGPWHETLDVSMSGGVQKVLYDKTVSNTINREFHFQQYAVYTVGRHPHNKDIIMVFYRGAPEIVLESCTYLTQHSAESASKKLSEEDRAIIFDRVNRWRMLDMSVEALATCAIHISDAPVLFQRLSNRVKNMRTGKVQTILCDYDKETISSCNQCKRKAQSEKSTLCEFCDLARVLFKDLKESTMIGIVSFANRPAPSVAPVLKALGKAGIRFSWFGSGCEPAVLDFGKSLGLETDWNCCLSLQDLPEGVSSRLPAGVSAIKKHVEGNDDVPLRVPMFCDATPSSVQSMIRLYQDNGEVVAVVGSSLKVENMEAFLAADLAFSVRPRVALRPSKVTEFHQQNNVLLAGKLISAPCTLTSNFSSEYFSSSLIQKILIARLVYINSQQAVFFTAHAAALLVLSQFLCCVVRMPPLVSAGHMGFITFFLIPALSASCLLSPDHESFPVIKRIPDKENDDDQGTLLRKQHLSYYSLALILPSAFLVFMTQAVSLIDPASASGSDIFARHDFPARMIEQAQVRAAFNV
jgi:magnesium-transporting ATPase (P-type)